MKKIGISNINFSAADPFSVEVKKDFIAVSVKFNCILGGLKHLNKLHYTSKRLVEIFIES